MNRALKYILLGSIGLAVLVMIFFLGFYTIKNGSSLSRENDSVDTPMASTFLNLAAGVKFVGDDKCMVCHATIYRTFKKNGMGRSFSKPGTGNIIEDFSKSTHVYDPKVDLHYEMIRTGDGFDLVEYRLDDDGKRIHELTKKIEYILGSGNLFRNYLYLENDFIFQAPISWYERAKVWDLSPGFHEINVRFSRPITQQCMNCHNSYTDYIEQSINRYRDPIPLGIGCERCHGPGELHVDKHFNAEFSGLLEGRIDSTIVNPKHLPTDLQLDVCMQCHLQGRFLIFNEGRKHTDLKPGMKVREVKTVYIDTDFKPGDLHTTDQGTQMMRSKCFTGSRGLMTCTTCHDPHASAPAKSASNEKCLLCHKVSALSRTNKKADHKKNSDCIHCHMPEKTEVVHVTFTDHWIRIVEEKTDSDINKNLSPAQHNIVSLKSIYDENDSIDSLRLGIAYAKFYNEEHIDSEYLLRAVPLLEEGLKNFPNHQKGRYYLGLTYILLKQFGKAQDHLELLVDKYPGNALGHRKLGWSYMKLGNVELAIDSYKKSISAYPMDVEVYYNLGNLYVSLNKNDKAIELYQKALEIRPDYAPAYNNLGNLFIAKLKKPEIAKNYYAKAVNNEPNLFTAMYNYAKVHIALGEEDEAIKLLGRTIKIYPRFSPAYIDLARLLKTRGQDQDAARILTKLLKLDPNNVDARTMLFQFNM